MMCDFLNITVVVLVSTSGNIPRAKSLIKEFSHINLPLIIHPAIVETLDKKVYNTNMGMIQILDKCKKKNPMFNSG